MLLCRLDPLFDRVQRMLNTVRHKLKRLSVNSFSIPSKPSFLDVILSSTPLFAMMISRIVSRMPNPVLMLICSLIASRVEVLCITRESVSQGKLLDECAYINIIVSHLIPPGTGYFHYRPQLMYMTQCYHLLTISRGVQSRCMITAFWSSFPL